MAVTHGAQAELRAPGTPKAWNNVLTQRVPGKKCFTTAHPEGALLGEDRAWLRTYQHQEKDADPKAGCPGSTKPAAPGPHFTSSKLKTTSCSCSILVLKQNHLCLHGSCPKQFGSCLAPCALPWHCRLAEVSVDGRRLQKVHFSSGFASAHHSMSPQGDDFH